MSKPTANKVLREIELIRQKNNRLWMDILRLAFYYAPDQAKRIMKQITKNDKAVTRWMARL